MPTNSLAQTLALIITKIVQVIIKQTAAVTTKQIMAVPEATALIQIQVPQVAISLPETQVLAVLLVAEVVQRQFLQQGLRRQQQKYLIPARTLGITIKI